MQALEARACARGNGRCHLVSTKTAHRFYLSRGYVDTGAGEGRFEAPLSDPMGKKI